MASSVLSPLGRCSSRLITTHDAKNSLLSLHLMVHTVNINVEYNVFVVKYSPFHIIGIIGVTIVFNF